MKDEELSRLVVLCLNLAKAYQEHEMAEYFDAQRKIIKFIDDLLWEHLSDDRLNRETL